MKIKSAKQINNKRCIIAIIINSLLVIDVMAGLLIRFFLINSEYSGTKGALGFRLFTILGGIIIGLSYGLCIPYAVDGLRTKNYHLPRWVVYAMLCGAACGTITFFTCLFGMWPMYGFYGTFIETSNTCLHLIAPLSSIILFIVINPYHTIKLKYIFIPITLPAIYLIVYCINVFIIKSWPDYYGFSSIAPWPISVIVFISIAIALIMGIAVLHNIVHKKQKKAVEEYYMESNEFAFKTIDDAIIYLASFANVIKEAATIIVPIRYIKILMKRYDAKESLENYINVYVNTYMERMNSEGNN